MYKICRPSTPANEGVVSDLCPQDLLLLLRPALVGPVDRIPSCAALATELSLTASEVRGAVGRAIAAQTPLKTDAGRPWVCLEPLRLFVQHGARYCFPATRGSQTGGVPTGYAALALSGLIPAPAGASPPVLWSYKDATVR